jgi:phage shock protein PspC (stress-responsive transcriptional regulator)
MKKLLRKSPKIFFGVCAGIADYFETDVSLVRIVFIFGNLFFGLPLISYFIMAIIIPRGY